MYDLLPPALLLLPLTAAGLLAISRKKTPTVPLVALGLATVALNAHAISLDVKYASAERATFLADASYLARFHGERVLYNVYSYHVVKSAGLVPVTDLHTLSHYALAGIEFKAVLEESEQRRYALIVGVPHEVLDQTTIES